MAPSKVNNKCKPHTTEEQRLKIIYYYGQGLSFTAIAKKVHCNRQTVANWIERFHNEVSIQNKPHPHNRRKTTTRTDQYLHRLGTRNPWDSAKAFQEQLRDAGITLSESTIRRRLNENGLNGKFAANKPLISKKNAIKRLNFAKEHIGKPLSFWKNIVWSDESKFQMHSNRKRRVWRMKNQTFKPEVTNSTMKHSQSIMVWGCFSYHGQGNLHEIKGIMNGEMYKNIIHDNLLPSVSKSKMRRSFIFQQDNDPKHTCHLVQKYFQESKIKLLEWPPQSPDLNPIENLWNELDMKITKSQRTNINTFKAALMTTWNQLSDTTFQTLIQSIPRRLQAVIDNKGYATKY